MNVGPAGPNGWSRHKALLIRNATKDSEGRTTPHLCAGLANYVRDAGERPIAIIWRLEDAPARPGQARHACPVAPMWRKARSACGRQGSACAEIHAAADGEFKSHTSVWVGQVFGGKRYVDGPRELSLIHI